MFIDRDSSLIEFERRVLEEASDVRHPLLERVKFLGILGRNLDEFVMVRGKEWIKAPHARRLVRSIHALVRTGDLLLRRDLIPALAEAGVHVIDDDALTCAEREDVDRRFIDTVVPLLVPLDAPQVPTLGMNYAVVVRGQSGTRRLAVVRLPDHSAAIVPITPSASPRGGHVFVWLEQLVFRHLNRVFPGACVESAHRFRILRDADVVPRSDEGGELSDRMVEALLQRETNPVMMMQVDRTASPGVVDELARALSVEPERITRMRRVVDLKRLWDFSCVQRPDLHDRPLRPVIPSRMQAGCTFSAIRAGDILLHHPYESFLPVVSLLEQAAADPDVRSISTTLYRTDRDESPVVLALADAARGGKDVRVIVELRARFDERRNAHWSRLLKSAGAQVFHGREGLKVHAKCTVIERHEDGAQKRYVHLSTGNYSTFTSTVYTDLSLMTCDPRIAADVVDLFEFAAGTRLQPPLPRAVLAAPFGLRQAFTALVEREMAWAARGEYGRIALKMNALVDHDQIELLYRASQAGVDVDLIVRGICCLRPGVRGLSDRIRVKSIVGRFLEHSRAWYFRNGGRHDVFVGSADVMPRNFDRRVEVVVPVRDQALASRVRSILDQYLIDTESSRELCGNGRYVRAARVRAGSSCQHVFLADAEVSEPAGLAHPSTAAAQEMPVSG